MNDDTVMKCLRRIETKWRATGKFWSDTTALTFSEIVADWEDYNGERAVNIFLFHGESSLDPSNLTRIYREINAGTETRAMPDPSAYTEQLSGKCPLQLMREGFEAGWEREHPGEPVPEFWTKLLTRLQLQRNRQELDIPANLRRYVATGKDPRREHAATQSTQAPQAVQEEPDTYMTPHFTIGQTVRVRRRWEDDPDAHDPYAEEDER